MGGQAGGMPRPQGMQQPMPQGMPQGMQSRPMYGSQPWMQARPWNQTMPQGLLNNANIPQQNPWMQRSQPMGAAVMPTQPYPQSNPLAAMQATMYGSTQPVSQVAAPTPAPTPTAQVPAMTDWDRIIAGGKQFQNYIANGGYDPRDTFIR